MGPGRAVVLGIVVAVGVLAFIGGGSDRDTQGVAVGGTILIGSALIAYCLSEPPMGGRVAEERSDPNRCRSCGYDLRGSPGSTCPECGADREDAAKS